MRRALVAAACLAALLALFAGILLAQRAMGLGYE